MSAPAAPEPPQASGEETSCAVTRTPDGAARALARAVWQAADGAAVEQHPDFPAPERDGEGESLLVAHRGGRPAASARVRERRSRGLDTAWVEFGPLFTDAGAGIAAIRALHAHYSGRGFGLLGISLGHPAGGTTALIEQAVAQAPGYRTVDDDRNWSSLGVPLTGPDDLLRGMSKGHRSGIRKALHAGLRVIPARRSADGDEFIRLMMRMHASRGHAVDPEALTDELQAVLGFLERTGLGELLMVTEESGQRVGGAVIVWQGRTARYFKGAADPDVRDVSVLHPALFEAMQRARDRGCTLFDLWGYNLHVGRTDQRYRINRFKKGFGGAIIPFPRTMFFPLGVRGRIYDTLRSVKGWLTRS